MSDILGARIGFVIGAFLAIAATVAAQAPLFRRAGEPIPQGFATRPPVVLATGDVDLDSDLDLVTTGGVMLNDGDGRFSNHAVPTTQLATAFAAALGDIDGDLDLDLFVVSELSPLAILLNDGTGGFAASPSIVQPVGIGCPLTTLNAPTVVSGDFDGDGLADVAFRGQICLPPFTNPAPSIRVWLCVGGVAFTDITVALPFWFLFSNLYDAFDFDGNGLDELIAADINGLSALSLVGGSTFSPSTILAASNNFIPAYARGDFDGDGVSDDVAFYGYTGTTPSASDHIMIRGPGGFGPPSSIPRPGANHGPAYAAVDVDGVIGDELVRVTLQGTEVLPVVGGVLSSTSIASARFFLPIGETGAPVFRVFAADVDGDGDQDLIAPIRNRVYRPAFNGGGAFVDPTGGLDQAFGASRIILGDFDGDGKLDVAAGESAAPGVQGVAMSFGNGRGDFSVPGPASAMPLGAAVMPLFGAAAVVCDLNGDGVDDVFDIPAQATMPARVLSANGLGGFTVSTIVIPTAPGTFPGVVLDSVAADLDGDGDLDVAATRWSLSAGLPSSPTTVFWNQGGGVFGTQFVGTGHAAKHVATADLDGNGFTDLVLAVESSNPATDPCVIIYNFGGGVFVQSAFAPALSAKSVATGDVDGDSDVDLLFDGAPFVNLGGGSFVAGPPATGAPNNLYVKTLLSDIDADGLPDLILAGGCHRGLGALGFGPFEPHLPIDSNSASTFASAENGLGDLDGDGLPDIVTSAGHVFRNARAHLARGATLRPGRLGSLEVFGTQLAVIDVYVSFGLMTAPISLAPYGTLYIDPSAALHYSTLLLDATGSGGVTGFLPPSPALVGLVLHWQAVNSSISRLSNACSTTVYGY